LSGPGGACGHGDARRDGVGGGEDRCRDRRVAEGHLGAGHGEAGAPYVGEDPPGVSSSLIVFGVKRGSPARVTSARTSGELLDTTIR
jgi:hypothetical protein